MHNSTNFIILLIVLIGSINYGSIACGYNIIEIIHLKLNELLKTETYSDKVIYSIIVLSAIILLFNKTLWLPFLGETVFPSEAFIPTMVKEDFDLSIPVKVKPNTRVAYWASLPQKNKEIIPDVEDAYADYSNSGVAISDNDGNVNLLILEGTSYKVPSGSIIKKHIHYRELDQEYGFLGEVKTVFY
jgi:hypothetical protein